METEPRVTAFASTTNRPQVTRKRIAELCRGLARHRGPDKPVRALIAGVPNTGKSTLIKIISGAYRHDSGEISYLGRHLSHVSPRWAIEHGITTIYQEIDVVRELAGMLQELVHRGLNLPRTDRLPDGAREEGQVRRRAPGIELLELWAHMGRRLAPFEKIVERRLVTACGPLGARALALERLAGEMPALIAAAIDVAPARFGAVFVPIAHGVSFVLIARMRWLRSRWSSRPDPGIACPRTE